MSLLSDNGIEFIYHHMPLHYLPFVAYSESLKSKSQLLKDGFSEKHFRTKSKILDAERGFGNFLHLTTDDNPNILKAKLSAGFPHISLAIPSKNFEKYDYLLCRYNIAMTRRLRKENKAGFTASPENGQYYNDMQIPVACTQEEKHSMLKHHVPAGTMIEVLLQNEMTLPKNTEIIFFSTEDSNIIHNILDEYSLDWGMQQRAHPDYARFCKHAKNVEAYVKKALANPRWRGDGLEFDKF